MYRAARRILDNDARSLIGVNVADVVQETMTQLMSKAVGKAFPDDLTNLPGFLYVVTKRQALDVVEEAKREGRRRVDPETEGTPLALRRSEDDFEQAIEDNLILEKLDACMNVLDKDELYAYTERFKRGTSLVEIGAGLGGKSDSWAARVCTRAIRKLTREAGIESPPETERNHGGGGR
jgi:RNA polymerase sigma factor (sigma-70 family)